MKKLPILLSIILFMVLLLIMPQTTKEGATAGITLCIYSVVPALLPYILITNYLLFSGLHEIICSFFQPIIGKLLKISKYGSFVVVLGLLCGYPMGAKILGEFTNSKKISLKESCYLITFCNNCSISFIVNYIFYTCLKSKVDLSTMLLLIYIPILLTALINRFIFKFKIAEDANYTAISISNPILNAFRTITILCGYVFLFTIITYFIKELVPLNENILYPLISFVEMTSGTSLLAITNIPHKLFIICAVIIFGGLSTVMQTFSLIPRFLRKYYLIGKLEQIAFLLIIYLFVA